MMQSAHVLILLTTATVLASDPAGEQGRRPPDPWPGPTGHYQLLEAETFQVDGEGWQVVEAAGAPPRALIASRWRALSGAARGQAVARHVVSVPADGRYRLWVRFTQMPRAPAGNTQDVAKAPFALQVRQGQAPLLAHTFADDEGAPMLGRKPAPEFRWQGVELTLARGPAELTLMKVGPQRAPKDLRLVDYLLLTTDLEYQPDHRDFDPQAYLRLTLLSSEGSPTSGGTDVAVRFAPMRLHGSASRYLDAQGMHSRGRSNPTLTTGQSTPWINLTRCLSEVGRTQMSLTIRSAPKVSAMRIQFATAPSDDAVVRTFERDGPGLGMIVYAPADFTGADGFSSDALIAGELLAKVRQLAPIDSGRRPVAFPMLAGLRADAATNSPGVRDAELEIAAYLGLSGRDQRLDPGDVEAGLLHCWAGNSVWYFGPGGPWDRNDEAIEKDLARAGQDMHSCDYLDRIRHLQIIDEGHPPSLSRMADSPVVQGRFAAWLNEHGYASDAPASLVTNRDGDPRLYFYSQRFRAAGVVDYCKYVTRRVHELYPPGMLTTINFSDGVVYQASFYAQGNDYFEYFKNRALDVAKSEDWTNAGAHRQLCGWNVALLRAATKYHRQPIHMYVIAYSGRKPLEVKLKAYSNLAQGAKLLSFYSFGPPYAGNELGWSTRLEMFPAVAQLTREVGAAEHILLTAMPRRAQAAILYSIPHDIWSVGHDNTQGYERMFTYLALRHAQIPVDVLSDDDVRSGFLDGYRLAYLFGDQLDPATFAPLAHWVHDGGTLVLLPGAGSRDQFNQPTAALDEALGVRRGPVTALQRLAGSSMALCGTLETKGRVLFDDGSCDLLAQRQTLELLPGARVLARFEDDQPAALEAPAGGGRVVLVGFMPALAYLRAAYREYRGAMDETTRRAGGGSDREMVAPLPAVAQAIAVAGGGAVRPADVRVARAEHQGAVPFRFDAVLRRFIVSPAGNAGVEQPVELDQALVEATFMEGEKGWVVPLANYAVDPIGQLVVTVRPGKACGDIHSSRLGRLEATARPDGSLRVTLPLESTDMIFAPWR